MFKGDFQTRLGLDIVAGEFHKWAGVVKASGARID